jgi:hypothetical protein
MKKKELEEKIERLYKALHEAIGNEEEFGKISSEIAELQVKKAIIKHEEESSYRQKKYKNSIIDYNYSFNNKIN